DTAHAGDAPSPEYYDSLPHDHFEHKYRNDGAVYRTPEYVEQECKNLIDQFIGRVIVLDTAKKLAVDAEGVSGTYINDEKYVIQNRHDIINLIYDIQIWGIERNITAKGGATGLSQIKKLRKELIELEAGLGLKDRHEIVDGIGD